MTGDDAAPAAGSAPAPFGDLEQYLKIPRLSGLALSPDDGRLVTTVSTLTPERTGFRSALWQVDPSGQQEAARLTQSVEGESAPGFTADGTLLFLSKRPSGNKETAAENPEVSLWELPAGGGEARLRCTRPGGISGFWTQPATQTVIVDATMLAGAADDEEEARLRKVRKEKKISAILHSGYPVRYWDHDLGPAERRLFALEKEEENEVTRLRSLSSDIGRGLFEADVQLSPDGRMLLAGVFVPGEAAESTRRIERIDTVTGRREILAEDSGAALHPGPISPDGSRAVIVRDQHTTPTDAPQSTLCLLDLTAAAGSAELVELVPGWDRWGNPQAWLPDGRTLVVTADHHGRGPIFLLDTEAQEIRQLTRDDAVYTDVLAAPDGSALYALRNSYAFPPEPVSIDPVSGEVRLLRGPVQRPELPGRLEELTATASDGTPVRSWLVLPEGSGPHPLLLWIHGGPLNSWNAWTWRWNPWILAARGYAVLLPDPALSTGYGQDFIQRGWGRWGAEPFTDLMATTDAAVARPDIDAGRTAAMGGSFGGYMANWVAGHTDRFRAIVSHASLWELPGFGTSTDAANYWRQEISPEMAVQNSPDIAVTSIKTPMLVIHGDKDYRVPIGEGLSLWYQLLAESALATDAEGRTPHRFLYFPDENHWILSPQHARIWYAVVESFLAEHVLGTDVPLPEELGL
ncbi:prolyl oligopeptidase family serine peptidase [Acaricomes phytoseiuli]|uniref:S9 family peptidase n=1 Tax=Acaricomes phytoseiuli TaxID=291968 RepID=UPI000382DB59